MTEEHENAQRRAQLSSARKALLEQWLQGKAARSSSAQAAIPRRANDQPAPLSFPQQRLWFVDQLDPGSAVYNMPGIVHLRGSLNVAALERSLDTIVRRHETLRTSFESRDGVPLQRVDPHATVPLRHVDLRDLPQPERAAALQQHALESARQPFDLSNGPLLRMTLLQLAADEHLLLLTMHHIIADGWSIGVFVRELSALYSALIAEQPDPLPELPIQYADFAVWQRQQAQAEYLREHLDYWKQQLADLPTLQLPTDRPRPVFQSFAGAKQQLRLPAALSQALKTLAQREDATLFMMLLAIWQLLLRRYSGQNDLVIGSVTAGRSRRELETLIGYFVDNLVLRTDLSGNPSFRELLRRTRSTTLDAFAHQDVPFEQLVETLQPERNPSYSPLFQVLFVFQPSPPGAIRLPDLTLQLEEGDTGTAKFDLTLNLEEREGQISGWIEYNTDLFEAATIERMAGHFQALAERIAAEPDARIAYLPLLTAAEQQQMLHDWNQSAADYPRAAAVHELIEAQATRSPERTAIVFAGESLTYAELNRRANQLAHSLRQQGVGPDVLVALCVERSLEMLVGMLAILKAGAAYVPLDPAYPADRLQYMLAHSQAPVILTQAALVAKLPEHGAQVFRLDADWPTLAQQPTHNPPRAALPQHLAYIIYTSGSTGRPKGVMVTQQGLLNLVHGLQAYFDDPAVENTGLITSISFDISVNQIFPTLIFGRTLHIIPDAVKFNSRALLRYLDEHQIHLLDAVPSYMQAILNEIAPERSPNVLRYLLIGGEKLEQRLLHAVFGQLGAPVTIVNIYGLTEISDINILGGIRATDLDKPITAGRPLQNNRIYILDQHMQPQPVGIAGEVCVSGESVSRGYLHRPELTAERFVVCPFEDGQIMVRTGDLGRWRADGTVEILGRIDHQVKVRGFRIETGEIEAVLAQHPAVNECVVVVREDAPAAGGHPDKRLVGYIAPRDGMAAPSAEELRRLLGGQLPDYMIPSAFVVLDALPKTPNGKLDRKALPAPDADRSLLASDYIAPRSQAEEMLAGIWMQVLGVQQVGVYDNFFALGGHSLLATQIASRVRDLFQVELPLRTLFATPTIAGLAEWIMREQREREGLLPPPLRPIERDGEPPLSFAQQRLWFLEQLQPGGVTYVIPAAVRLTGTLDLAALEHSLNAVAQRHETLRTTFGASSLSAQPVQRIAPSITLPLPLDDLSNLPPAAREAELERRIARAVEQPFDLVAGPLLRAFVLRVDAEEHVLLLTMHHIIADGWSLGVLIREIAAHYSAAVTGQTAQLPALPIQYADYALWQRRWLAPEAPGEVLNAQLGYWRQQLAGAPSVLELPTDRPRPAVPSLRGAIEPIRLPAALTDRLRRLSQQEGATLFMTLLAAWQSLLGHYSGARDIVVGSPIANRNLSETENLIGFFVNTLVLRGNLAGNPQFRELLRRTRATTLAAYAHQDLPFEQLVEELRPVRDPSYTPIFQVLFALQNAPLPELTLPGLTARRMDVEAGAVKFDLSLALEETPDGISGVLEYSVDLFDAATIQRLAGHYTRLLELVAADPEQRLFDLPLLTEAELALMLHQWNATEVPYSADRCVQELFEAQAAATPELIAVDYNGQTLSYAELNRRANQLAHYLRRHGIRPELPVGICVERSLESMIGFLGILKAGGVYVPLDPAYPAERLAYMIADSETRLLLIQEQVRELLAGENLQLVCLDADWPEIAREDASNPVCVTTPDHLAYIIYTSGSTGRPKGVMMGHRGLVNLTEDQTRVCGIGSGSRVLQFASTSFDASLWEIVFPLLTGGTVCIADRHDLLPGPNLVRLLEEREITNAHLLPSTLAILPQAELPRLTTLDTGAEKCTAEVVARWLPGRRMLNGYGPTETTVYSTVYECTEALPYDPPIGRPIANTQIYLLSPRLHPVPIGVVGEIYIGGAGMSRGYLKQPDLTAAKFIPDPFSGQLGARLYKTGDLGRYLPDGNILYIGRADQQIKLRGFRIELGEIESVLGADPSVRTSIVQVREPRPGDKQIVAYLLPEPGHSINIGSLRNILAATLPEYMVPSSFIVLDELPLTPNSKIDYAALPLPDGSRPELAAAYVPPRTELEQQIAAIWRELLHVDQVGLHDNFFDLGGHSLLVVQLNGRLSELLNTQISMIDLFKYPTISALSEYLSRSEAANSQPAAPEQQHKSVKQGRNWLKQRLGNSQRADKE
jgi:surfactin family lipopeptide synthetase A